MEKRSYFWLNYIEECSTLSISANNGKVFVFLVKLYRGVFHPINFSLMVNFSSLWGWEGNWSPTGCLLVMHCCTLCVWGLVTLPGMRCCILCVGTGRIAWCMLLYIMCGNWLCCLTCCLSFADWRVQVVIVCLLPSRSSMNVHHSNSKNAPYYPMRYFRRQVVAWMIKHRQLVMANKGVALMANYGLEEEDGQFKGPLSYKQYLQHVLQHRFLGDEIILHAISCMWNLRITVLNSRTLEEYRIWHSFSLADADVGIVYNCVKSLLCCW